MKIQFALLTIACLLLSLSISTAQDDSAGSDAKSGSDSKTTQQQQLWCQYTGQTGPGTGKHIVLISGDDEYRSEEALPMLGKILSVHHGFKCTVLFAVNDDGIVQPNHQTNIPGLESLKTADLVIMGLRFRNLPDDQMALIDEYVESGKPMIGVRTTTHAFNIKNKDSKYKKYSFNHRGDQWKGGFGREVLGETWIAHHGKHGKESTRAIANEAFADHPVMTGVKDVWGTTDVYRVKNLADSADVLLHGQILTGMKPTDEAVEDDRNDPMMPIAWIRSYKTSSGAEAKILCTTMGAATDFLSADLRRMTVNAAFWAVGMTDSIKPDLNVEFVDPYEPTKFGFKSFKKNRAPSFYDLKATAMEK